MIRRRLMHNSIVNGIIQRNIGFLKRNFRHGFYLPFLLGLLFLFFPLANSFGRDVSFQWIANTDTPSVDGYRLYYKLGDPGPTLKNYFGTNASGGNPSPIELPGQSTTFYTLGNLLDSERYSFVLTAYRSMQESPSTNAVTLEAITPIPGSLTAKINANVLTGESPLPLMFDATTSTGTIAIYEWTYGDGMTGTGAITSHTYSSEGSYTVTLKVTDTIGATDQATVSIVVTTSSNTNNPPSAVISSSSSVGNAPLAVEFDGSASTDNDGNITSYGWDFGDGGNAGGALANHIFNIAGMFNTKLTVTDNGGLNGTSTTPVLVSEPAEVSNTGPTAVINSSASKGYAPLSVSFNGGKSYDPDGNVQSYIWSFGDGTIATGANVTHKFLQPAVYRVTLKVKDNNGASSYTATFTVNVLDKDQKIDSVPDSITQSLSAIYYLLFGPKN